MNKNSDFTPNIESRNFLNTDPKNIKDLESIMVHIGRDYLQERLESCEETHPKPQTRCRECGKFANYISNRVGFYQSRFGVLRYKRAYYVCPSCHQSTCPLDERLDPVKSLARLRAKLDQGLQLPVGEIARDWGLGYLQNSASNYSFDLTYSGQDNMNLKVGIQGEPVEVNPSD